jgi:hypothetical protein
MGDELLWGYSGGWVYYPTPDSQIEVRVRFVERPDGRLEPADVWVSHPAAISASALRAVPLGKIEAAVNAPGVAAALREKMGDEWVTPEADLAALKGRLAPVGPPQIDREAQLVLAAQLDIPEGGANVRKPDEFYRQVATAYQQVGGLDRRPARVLAERNGVPVSTVHRWVKEARARGFLAPGRRLSRRASKEQEAS